MNLNTRVVKKEEESHIDYNLLDLNICERASGNVFACRRLLNTSLVLLHIFIFIISVSLSFVLDVHSMDVDFFFDLPLFLWKFLTPIVNAIRRKAIIITKHINILVVMLQAAHILNSHTQSSVMTSIRTVVCFLCLKGGKQPNKTTLFILLDITFYVSMKKL